MVATIFKKQSVMAICVVVLLGVAWMGCSAPPIEPQPAQPGTGPTPEGTAAGAEVGRVYLDDVRVPSDLEYDADESIVYETPKFKAGVMHFSKWRADVPALIGFFMDHMVQDKWTFVNAFRGKEAFLSFSKPDKTCTIRITESWTGTVKVTIAVGPLGEKKN